MAKINKKFTEQVHIIADKIKEINELLIRLESRSEVRFQVASFKKEFGDKAPDKSHFVIEIYPDRDLPECKVVHALNFEMVTKELDTKLEHLRAHEGKDTTKDASTRNKLN